MWWGLGSIAQKDDENRKILLNNAQMEDADVIEYKSQTRLVDGKKVITNGRLLKKLDAEFPQVPWTMVHVLYQRTELR